MQGVKTVRAVERAFHVLRALQGIPGGATLVELQVETGLSGPTLLRLLRTLIEQQAVRRSTTDRRYRNSVLLHGLVQALEPTERMADVAAPWLDSLCQQVEWPSDLTVHQDANDFMVVLESSLRQSRFYVRRAPGRVRVNLFGSAAGTAFLAALSLNRRAELADAGRSSRDIHNQAVIAANDMEERIQTARRLGYATRHPLYRGGGYNRPRRDDALQAIAVPIIHGSWLLGALNINWNRAAMTEKEMVRRHLAALRAAASGIAAAAADHGLLPQFPGLEAACSAEELREMHNRR